MEYLSYWEFYFQGKSSQGICNGRHNSRSSKLSVVFWLVKACLLTLRSLYYSLQYVVGVD